MTRNAKKYFDAKQMELNRLALVAIAAQERRKRANRVTLMFSAMFAIMAAFASFALVRVMIELSIIG